MANCGGCDAAWTGAKIAHCAACHETFTTPGNFDKHRNPRGEHGSCQNPAKVGLVRGKRGYWTTDADSWVQDISETGRERGDG